MGFSVMLVDDDANLTVFLQRAVVGSGAAISLLHVDDGVEAIDYLSKAENNIPGFPLPDLILLDIKMPRVDGFEVLQWKQRHPGLQSLPVVMWSSSALAVDQQRALALGAVDYVVKPMDLAGLEPIVRDLEVKIVQNRRRTTTPLNKNLSSDVRISIPGSH